MIFLSNVYMRLINSLRRNHNRQLQAKGIVHEMTNVPIEEEFAMNTEKGYKPKTAIKVHYLDGSNKIFSPGSWMDFGKGVLKHCVIVKLEMMSFLKSKRNLYSNNRYHCSGDKKDQLFH